MKKNWFKISSKYNYQTFFLKAGSLKSVAAEALLQTSSYEFQKLSQNWKIKLAKFIYQKNLWSLIRNIKKYLEFNTKLKVKIKIIYQIL